MNENIDYVDSINHLIDCLKTLPIKQRYYHAELESCDSSEKAVDWANEFHSICDDLAVDLRAAGELGGRFSQDMKSTLQAANTLPQYDESVFAELEKLKIAISDPMSKIPVKYRSFAMTKKEALNYFGHPAHFINERQALDWLTQGIRDGDIVAVEIHRKKMVFDIRQFPEKIRNEIKMFRD